MMGHGHHHRCAAGVKIGLGPRRDPENGFVVVCLPLVCLPVVVCGLGGLDWVGLASAPVPSPSCSLGLGSWRPAPQGFRPGAFDVVWPHGGCCGGGPPPPRPPLAVRCPSGGAFGSSEGPREWLVCRLFRERRFRFLPATGSQGLSSRRGAAARELVAGVAGVADALVVCPPLATTGGASVCTSCNCSMMA